MRVKPNNNSKKFQLRPIVLTVLAVLSSSSLPLYAAGDFFPLGELTGGKVNSSASAVSANGNVVVGESGSTNGTEAFRWTQAGGMVGLGDLAGGVFESVAKGVSADGSVVVGTSKSSLGTEAFRWTSTGMVGLGDLAGSGFYSIANGVNADGSVVVGQSLSSVGFEAYRWTQAGGMVGLGDLAGGGVNSQAYGVSANGSVVVGQGSSSNGPEAFRWTSAGMVGLGDLAGGSFASLASATNADGSVVVGYGNNANGREAIRWTQAGGMVGLGVLDGGLSSQAYGVSADGSVVVGKSETDNGDKGFRWTQAGGMVNLADWLTAAGVTIAPGFGIGVATGVSADGNVIVGLGLGTDGAEAFLARVSPLGSGVINPVANTQSVIETGARALQAAVTLPNMVLFGAHHRTILDNGLVRSANNNGCAWATGDFGRNNESEAKMGMAEMGICKDLGSARIGIGFGLDWAKQDLNLGGEAKYNGQHVLIEAANAFENGLQPSVTAYYGRYDADVNRHYQNAGNTDSSHGSTEASSKAIRLRLDWKDMAQLGSASITPYAAYTWMRTNLDGYTESGGGFPVQYDNNRWTTNDVRLGAAANFAATTSTNVRIGAEAVHRFEDNTASGKVLGLNSFSYQGKDIKQNWVRATADVDHRFTDDMLVTVGLNAGTGGGDNNWGVTAGLRANF